MEKSWNFFCWILWPPWIILLCNLLLSIHLSARKIFGYPKLFFLIQIRLDCVAFPLIILADFPLVLLWDYQNELQLYIKIGSLVVRISLGTWPSLLSQPRYEALGDLLVENWTKAQWLTSGWWDSPLSSVSKLAKGHPSGN